MALLLRYTIPDCREEKWKGWYMATFGGSIVWIGLLSFVMVDFATRCAAGHPPRRRPSTSPPQRRVRDGDPGARRRM